jgi:hypothetical protein
MLLEMFAIFDSKAGCYTPPFMFRTRGEAIRMFEASANSPDHQFFNHAEDFTLFHLGVFDDSDGSVESLPTPEPIGKAIEFRRQVEAPLFNQLETE